ncbi:uncharacterized protein LOC111244488 [Varroa destructor]|uniref:Uncharacterized protein n=1 Tax=Varroa destructor TaxID=109461 RepID=A0A7M7J6V0_VARDE|nr:uncharacterized protein LOC111244488 [Varroa destructor]
MDAEALAVALVSGGRGESEKFRLIRSSFPAEGPGPFTRADVAFVQSCLGRDRRLVRLALEFADVSCNRDFAIAELSSGNTITSRHVATRFHWLYTTESILNEAFLSNELVKMSHSTRLKVFNSIGKNVTDVQLGDQLWNFVKTKFLLRDSNRLLAACSNSLILREVSTSKIVQLTDAQMLQILQKRFDSGIELLQALAFAQKNSTFRKPVAFDNSLHYILLKDFEKGFNILTETAINKSLGANRTRSLLKAFRSGGSSSASRDRIVKYSIFLHRKALRRYAPTDLYLECFVRNNIHLYSENDLQWRKQAFRPEKQASVHILMSWLTGLSMSVKREFLEALFRKTYNKPIMDVPTKVFPEMLYILSEEERLRIVNWRLQKKEYSLARITCSAVPSTKEYFWRSMLPCYLSFPDLKHLLAVERNVRVREILYRLIVTSAVIQCDSKAIEMQLNFVVERCRSEQSIIYKAIFETLEEYYCLKNRVKANIWPALKKLFDMILLKERRQVSVSCLRLLVRLLEKVNPDDIDTVKQMAETLTKVHVTCQLLWPESIMAEFKRLHRRSQTLVLKTILEAQEPYLMIRQKEGYSKTLHMWRIFEAVDNLKLKIDFRQYPNSLAFLKHLVSGDDKRAYWESNKIVRRAYQLIKDFLTEGDSVKKGVDGEHDAHFTYVRIRHANDVASCVDINVILSGTPLAILIRICQLLAANDAITPRMLQMSLSLLDDPERRVSAARFLALCLPTCDLPKHFNGYCPEQDISKIDPAYYEVQKAMLNATKLISDSAIALEIIGKFMQGDYLKMAVHAFNYHCSKAPPAIVLPLLTDGLTNNSSVVKQKEFLRWFFIYTSDHNAKLNEIFASAKSSSVKRELLKIAYRKAEADGDEAWPTLQACLNIQETRDKQTLILLFTKDCIDDRLNDYLPDLFRFILTCAEDMSDIHKLKFSSFLDRAACYISRIPQNLAQSLCVAALEQAKLSATAEQLKYCSKPELSNYIGRFALQNGQTNLKFLEDQLELLLKEADDHIEPTLWIIIRTICNAVVESRRIDGADHLSVLQAMHRTLRSQIATCLLQSVYVELIQIIMDLVPAKNADQTSMVSFVLNYTMRGIELICERLDEFGNQMTGLLAPLLTDAIEIIIGKQTEYHANMVETYTATSPIRHAWLLIDCLPPKGSLTYIKNSETYDQFIDKIQHSSNVALKVMLKYKLNVRKRKIVTI